MKIENITLQLALELMGSEATEAEAVKMIETLRQSGREDTSDFSDEDFFALTTVNQ